MISLHTLSGNLHESPNHTKLIFRSCLIWLLIPVQCLLAGWRFRTTEPDGSILAKKCLGVCGSNDSTFSGWEFKCWGLGVWGVIGSELGVWGLNGWELGVWGLICRGLVVLGLRLKEKEGSEKTVLLVPWCWCLGRWPSCCTLYCRHRFRSSSCTSPFRKQ